MREKVLDVLKWALIFMIAGAVFYVVYPKYQMAASDFGKFNTVTGKLSPNGDLLEKGR